jgi:hypothetical protein
LAAKLFGIALDEATSESSLGVLFCGLAWP